MHTCGSYCLEHSLITTWLLLILQTGSERAEAWQRFSISGGGRAPQQWCRGGAIHRPVAGAGLQNGPAGPVFSGECRRLLCAQPQPLESHPGCVSAFNVTAPGVPL